MVDLLTALSLIPVMLGVSAELADKPLKYHALLSLTLQVPLYVVLVIPIVLGQLGWATITLYGITLPTSLTFLWFVFVPMVSIGLYWLAVGMTKFAEKLVPGL